MQLSLALFWKTYACFYILSYVFHLSTHEYIQDEFTHAVRAQQMSQFCHPPRFFVS